MQGFYGWLSQLRLESLFTMLLTVCSCLLCVTVHECCHGLAAYAMGDPTAKQAGRLTLNPLRHIDLMGLVMLALVKFGWAKPVPVDMRRFRNPRAGMALTALAGPAGNVVLTAVAMLLHGVCYFYELYYESAFWAYLDTFCVYTAVLSAGLGVFNLIPVPPLDGSKVLFSVLPPKWYLLLMRYERYGMIAMMVLLLTGVLDTPLTFLREGLIGLMDPIAVWPYRLLVGLYFGEAL